MEIAESFGRRLEDLPLMAGNHDTTVWFAETVVFMATTDLATHSASCRRYGQRTRTVSFSGKFDLTKPAQPHEGATVSIRAIRAEKVETKRAQRALRSFPYIILWFYLCASFQRSGKGKNEKSATCVALFPLHYLMVLPLREFSAQRKR